MAWECIWNWRAEVLVNPIIIFRQEEFKTFELGEARLSFPPTHSHSQAQSHFEEHKYSKLRTRERKRRNLGRILSCFLSFLTTHIQDLFYFKLIASNQIATINFVQRLNHLVQECFDELLQN